MKRVPLTEQEFTEMMASEPKNSITLKCKPVYDYQSIEFEYEIRNGDDIANMFELYSQLLDGLMNVAPEQPDRKRIPAAKLKKELKPIPEPKEQLATEAQLKILNDFNIPHKRNVTKLEAQKLIRESVERAKAEQKEWKSEL